MSEINESNEPVSNEWLEEQCDILIKRYGGICEISKLPGESALDAIIDYIYEQIDESDYPDLVDKDIEEDDITYDIVLDAIEMALAFCFNDLKPFENEEITIYRTIRIAPRDEIVSGPTAGDIGISWTTESCIECPDFLDQYGSRAENAIDVTFSANIAKHDINWIDTFERRINPRVSDYLETVIKPDAVLNNLTIDDIPVEKTHELDT